MQKLEDPEFGHAICLHCAIDQAKSAKDAIDRTRKYRHENKGEEAGQNFHSNVEEWHRKRFEIEAGMQLVEWRLYNELAHANDRTCSVVNYFRCPYTEERGSSTRAQLPAKSGRT